jgi:hypothetical protein
MGATGTLRVDADGYATITWSAKPGTDLQGVLSIYIGETQIDPNGGTSPGRLPYHVSSSAGSYRVPDKCPTTFYFYIHTEGDVENCSDGGW